IPRNTPAQCSAVNSFVVEDGRTYRERGRERQAEQLGGFLGFFTHRLGRSRQAPGPLAIKHSTYSTSTYKPRIRAVTKLSCGASRAHRGASLAYGSQQPGIVSASADTGAKTSPRCQRE